MDLAVSDTPGSGTLLEIERRSGGGRPSRKITVRHGRKGLLDVEVKR